MFHQSHRHFGRVVEARGHWSAVAVSQLHVCLSSQNDDDNPVAVRSRGQSPLI